MKRRDWVLGRVIAVEKDGNRVIGADVRHIDKFRKKSAKVSIPYIHTEEWRDVRQLIRINIEQDC